MNRDWLMMAITHELLLQNRHRSRTLEILAAQFEVEYAKELHPEKPAGEDASPSHE